MTVIAGAENGNLKIVWRLGSSILRF